MLSLISDNLDHYAIDRPDQDFLVLGEARLTYREAKELVDRTARALLAAGIEKGDRVAMLSAPRPEFFSNFLAVTSIGAIWVGLNPKYTPAELDQVVRDAEPSLLFGFAEVTGESQLDKLQGLVDANQSVRQLILFDSIDPVSATSWVDFLAAAECVTPESLATARSEVDPLDPAYLVYTSGTTGRPKGALLTHRGSNFCNVIAVERKALSDRSIVCNLPINHVGAIGDICGRTLTGGGTIHFQERFDPLELMLMIERERLNTIGGVPTMLQMCVSHPEFDRIDLTSVDLIAWGGAAMPVELLQTLMDKTECTRCTMGYGMTETTGGVTYSGLTDSVELLATTVGTPDPRQPLRIWHGDDREAADGETGEIQVSGNYLMAGYWRLPEASAEAFTVDGWLHTGDLAVRRTDGYIQIVGRMSEMFKSGGYNVYPREVELALEEHPTIAMAAVISVPDPKFQEVGIAYVMCADGSEVDVDELRSFASERLANYKLPKQINVVTELPILPIGKVDKNALRSHH
ncbi:MAG: class I adenylate-forming enzyme family protein [Acidimicrobiales bacterium]